MLGLANPEARRGLRAVVQALGALAGIVLLAWIISISAGQPGTVYMIASGLLGLAGIREFFYGAENVTRAVKLNIGKDGISAGIGDDANEEQKP